MPVLTKLLKSFLLFFSLYISPRTEAQQPVSRAIGDTANVFLGTSSSICGNDLMLYSARKDPAFRAREEKMNQGILNEMRTLDTDTIYLPVVVHIVNPNPSSITDLQVINGINLLNEAFSKSGTYSGSKGADTKIRFCLSKQDPDGGNSTGITRTTSYFSDHLNRDIEDARLKNLIQWEPSKYINIWLITGIDAESYVNFSCGIYRLGTSGYATMPPGGGALDGIVVTAFGALLAHETGHYLGLYHTFEGGCSNNDCLQNGDMVCDTPPDGSVYPSFGCNASYNSCNSDTLSNYSNGFFHTDVPDRIANFMDYGNSTCSNEFTQGQADRMRAAIASQRSGLLQNKCSPPCPENITANFTRDIAYPVTGDVIAFTNTSSGAANFQWLINDIVISTNANFSYAFNAIGKYKVTLKAFNTIDCFAAYSDYVIVNCGVTARFYTDKQTIASKVGVLADSIVFTNTSFNGITYQWLMSNNNGMAEQAVSTNTNITYIFPVPANYTMRLIATNGACSDTTALYTIPVLDPTPDAAPYNVRAYCFQETKVKVDFCIVDWGIAPLRKNMPVTFYDADPNLPAAHKLSPTFYLPYDSPGGNCLTCYTHVVDVKYPFVDKLYMVIADSGNKVPVVLPNTPLIEKDYINNFYTITNLRFKASATPATATLLPGDTLQLAAAGFPTPPGGVNTYLWSRAIKLSCTNCSSPFLLADSDRIKRVIVKSSYGCTDTAYVDIKVPPADDYTIRLDGAICSSHDSMNVNFTVNNGFIRGVIPKNLKISFYNGDPSTTNATLLLPVFTVPDTTFSRQQSYSTKIKLMPQGNLYAVVNDSSRLLPVSLPNTAQLEKNYINNVNSLFYQPNKTIVSATICQGQNYAGHSAAGSYTDTLTGYNGCDSIRTLQLTLNPVFNTIVTSSICQGQNYAGHTTSGTFTDVYAAMNGCDSTRTLHLTVLPVFATNISASICAGHNYAGHSESGIYTDVYTAANGCDSTRTLLLTVKPTFASIVTIFICQGQNYGGHTESGIYTDVYTAVNGCDSTRTLHLTVKPTFVTAVSASICEGQQYAGHTKSGIYTDVYTAVNGCDSTRTLNLSVNPLKFTTIVTSICQGENYAGHSTAGRFTDVYTTIHGCDSTRTLYLIIKDTVSTKIDTTICQDENYGGHSIQGTYIDVFTAANGCDSTRTLHLSVKPKSFFTISAQICMGDSYLAGGNFQTATGIYKDTLQNYLGCDSVITTNLTVHPLPLPNLGKDRGICIGDVLTLNPGAFATYLWHDGSTSNTFHTNSVGKYDVSVTNNFGCKASDTMNVLRIDPLPINFLPLDTSLCRGNIVHVSLPGNTSYLWSTGSTASFIDVIKTGTYTLQLTDNNGCLGVDSMKILYYNCATVWIPSAFTPDTDNLNDIFKPIFPAPVLNYHLQIWNRWGYRIFESSNSSIGWDGKFKSEIQPTGAYVYVLTFKDIDGMNIKKTGVITLVR